ncbi:hypothetical protein AB835_09275 [Candidatus Endobugula sertula]|uniref:Secretin/TonB short N-terminal domain-containing protein n=1 Tax=Candidatus Endobugula sertula TaxID=62101 RepID=A0A1D2QP23_9GAMM|nr:hypothetical protein AB835_09275 [Candidatus Endobugula sertula]
MKKIQQEIDEYKKSEKIKQEANKKASAIRKNYLKKEEIEDEYRFTIKTDRLPADIFFVNLMTGAGNNIVVHPDVTGEITLNLKSVTVKEVLNVMREVYGFDYKYNNAIYTIFPKKLRTEIFPINYIDVQRVGVSDTSVLTGNVESSSQSGEQSSNQSASLVEGGGVINSGSRIQTRSETNFWASLNSALSQLIGVNKKK